MKRRNFIQQAAAALILPVVIDGYGASAYGQSSSFINRLAQLADANDRVLVLIQLNGGNDGLNMVIPLDQMSQYTNLRSTIAIPEAKVLRLESNQTTGIHPAMTGLQQLYNEGKVSLVHSVSYPSPSFSHFRASDIWFTAEGSDQTQTTGWMGRYLNEKYPNYPDNYPNDQMPDPLAIQISYIASTALLGPKQSMALALQNPDTFAQLVGDKPTIDASAVDDTAAGRYIDFIRQQQTSSVQYAAQIKAAALKGKNLVSYPTPNALADQLKIVARLIHGGLRTKVYYVSMGGFDTHASQVSGTDTTVGAHANLMQALSDGIKSFQDDLAALSLEDRVVGMTFSEFGRRAISNSSLGTDHGVAAPLFVFGKAVKTAVIGKNPNLSDLDNNNIKMQTDFRQVYTTLLSDWLAEGSDTVSTVMGDNFKTVPIFQQLVTAVTEPTPTFSIYPNPATNEVRIESDAFGNGVASIRLLDAVGQVQSIPVNRLSTTAFSLTVQTLPAGTYFITVERYQQPQLTGRLLVAH